MIEANINNIPEKFKGNMLYRQFCKYNYNHFKYVVTDLYKFLLEYLYISDYRDYTHRRIIMKSAEELRCEYLEHKTAEIKDPHYVYYEVFFDNYPVIESELKEIYRSVREQIIIDAKIYKMRSKIDIDTSKIPEELPEHLNLDNVIVNTDEILFSARLQYK